ncbi:hypothetical protein C8Q74DRAFT_1223410 [Fomes fomentarius]|nr:hypothetical protein C8Q74DRAFT_1223410 [Fomes fomentarius]
MGALEAKPRVTAPIVGTTSLSKLEDALDVELSHEDIRYLEEPYEPTPIIGHA